MKRRRPDHWRGSAWIRQAPTDISHGDEFLTTAGDDGVNQSASRRGPARSRQTDALLLEADHGTKRAGRRMVAVVKGRPCCGSG